jgi:prepilin-type N-terminal cleavage/methylation domain-containing protein
MAKNRAQSGYTLIELVVVLVIIGIITAVGLRSLTEVNETGRFEETRSEMDRLAIAICGDPTLVSGGARSDFGYVGDVGALPPNLDALTSNPGGYATWDGPYISNEFSDGGATDWFKFDGWGIAYIYSGGRTIGSTGGSTALTRELAGSIDDLLYNDISIVITDLDKTPPGAVYADSVRFDLIYPNGSGGLTTDSRYPRPDGLSARYLLTPVRTRT